MKVHLNYLGFNTAQFPSYHKLDINFNYSFDWIFDRTEVYLNLYNVYNRKNPFARFVVIEENEGGVLVPVMKEIVLFPFIPSIGINVTL